MFQRYVENISDNYYFNIREWKSIDKISENMILAVLASEDGNFTEHCGFDWDAIRKAMEHNRRSGNKRYGASTISQQTAKNVYLLPARTWMRKGFEAYFTVLIELFWSKRRIMEVYLNIIEVGDGLYGVEAAAKTYFNKSADRLTAYEAAQIASILPGPRIYNLSNPSPKLRERQIKIRKLMRQQTWNR
jgi:monofunctional biosynthetic peptidoglycan transglycosylase